jgi:iron complex transport system ATP-binding protein
VLHDLPVALRADRVIVLRAGRIAADGVPADPDLQRAVEQVFDGAIRIDARPGRAPAVELALDVIDAGTCGASSGASSAIDD